MNKIKAIPTTYNGIRYRSRLEATWACFFDSLGWEHEYEPFDLDGYIPDFVLRFPKKNVLVEVKPMLEIESELTRHYHRYSKVVEKNFDMFEDLLMVGRSPWHEFTYVFGYLIAPDCHCEDCLLPMNDDEAHSWSKVDVFDRLSLRPCNLFKCKVTNEISYNVIPLDDFPFNAFNTYDCPYRDMTTCCQCGTTPYHRKHCYGGEVHDALKWFSNAKNKSQWRPS